MAAVSRYRLLLRRRDGRTSARRRPISTRFVFLAASRTDGEKITIHHFLTSARRLYCFRECSKLRPVRSAVHVMFRLESWNLLGQLSVCSNCTQIYHHMMHMFKSNILFKSLFKTVVYFNRLTHCYWTRHFFLTQLKKKTQHNIII